ncbi:MAG: hypothetical protein L0229_05875 [Blastocatellia bacterium]|nr:hypothetical protein [Blastocatellia bacterium]
MTSEEMERAIEFLLNSQGQLTADVQGLKDAQAETARQIAAMVEAQKQTSRDVMTLAGVVSDLSDTVARIESEAETNRQEMRYAIDNLIAANEGTRKLAEDVAQFAIQSARRITDLESKLP